MIRVQLGSHAAIYTPAGPDGDGPYADPLAYPAETVIHDAYDYFGGATVYAVTIAHPAVPAATPVVATFGLVTVTSYSTPHVADVLLATHNKGYGPSFLVQIDDEAVPNGMPIAAGARRRVTPYATDTEIRMKVVSSPGSVGVDAVEIDYSVTVFREAGPVEGAPSFYLSPSRVSLAYGALDSAERSLRLATLGESELQMPRGPVAAVGGGHFRYITPAGTVVDTSSTVGLVTYAYDGDFAGSEAIGVIVR